MSKTRLFTIAAVMCLCAAGCSDDNVININNSSDISEDKSDGTCDKKCPSGQVCKDGSCVESGTSEAKSCSKTANTCIDENTVKVCVKGKKPVEKACDEGRCFEGECLTECTVSQSECLSDNILSVCKAGKAPTTLECSNEKIRGACVDGECVSRDPAIGLACDLETICPEGSYCEYGDGDEMVCTPFSHLGESCEKAGCEADLICDESICKKQVSRGEPCDELSFCETYTCVHGICSDYSTLYGECDDSLLCPSDAICIEHQCVPTKGNCTSNRDCKGDSYCCLDSEACKANLNVCVPYSETTTFDPTCELRTKPGIFEASVQCYWRPTEERGSTTVYNSAIVGKIHNARGIETPLVAFVTTAPPIIRIVEPENCETIENLRLNANGYDASYNNVSLADFDGDGYMEIVIMDNNAVIYYWDSVQNKHVPRRINGTSSNSGNGTVSIHDLDNDGVPEIINTRGQVFHADGMVLSQEILPAASYTTPVLGDLDGDGYVEFISDNNVYRWQPASNGWTRLASLNTGDQQATPAYADFGTPSKDGGAFDFEHLDGRAEVVLSSGRTLQIWSLFAEDGSLLSRPLQVMNHAHAMGQAWGYPPAIGDFDGDGFPEIGVASRSTFGVYNPKCTGTVAGKCARRNVAWDSPTQDMSGIAGASAFDFDGDGKIEIVYGDECFTRVYDGMTGEILFSSYRNSGTVIEYPVIADVDGDGSTEIVVSSDSMLCGQSVDNSHRGVKCEDNSDCYSGSCIGGLCRCTSDTQCNWQTINGSIFNQYRCMTALPADREGGNVCRAIQGPQMPGITILRDRLDRWVSSRTLWNQHSYNITNINDDGSIPKTSDWKQNFTTPGLNNFRQQRQGTTGAGTAPDITGRFTSAANTCIIQDGNVMMTAQVCNRGTKAVGSRMPAVFYKGSVEPQNILCVSYTDEMVPVQGCKMVSCAISAEMAESLSDTKIILKVNDDGKGGKTTVECNEDNNTDEIFMKGCTVIN